MSHHLGVIHFSLPAGLVAAEQVHARVRAKLDWELDALDKAGRSGPDYYTFAGLVELVRVAECYAAYAYNPTSADSYDKFGAFARWLSLEDPTIASGQRRSIKAEALCGAVIDAVMPSPPDGHDTESADVLIDSFDVSEWKAERFCRYVMNAVSARVMALNDYPSRVERLIRSETWRPSVAAELGHPFIYAADGADIMEGPNGLTPAERVAHPRLRGRSILPPSGAAHWLAFVDFHS
jgi:hypothetical protein